MSQANIRPHAEGFQISQIKRSSFFRKMGLRNGDVITAADSSPIKTVSDALDIWRNLTGKKKTSLEIKRRGRTRIIDYNIR
jgi:general secretion pathway protein C